MTRNLEKEMDQLKARVDTLQKRVHSMDSLTEVNVQTGLYINGHVRASGEWNADGQKVRVESKEHSISSMIQSSSEDSAKILAALGHKQRLDILKCLLIQPCTGNDLLETLGMSTTGQLYHHLKALIGANLVEQKERGGLYNIPSKRAIPLMMILTGTNGLLDVARFVMMTEIRENPDLYIGGKESDGYDANQLLLALLEYSLQEIKEGYGNKITITFNENGSVTVSDNGRGIPVTILNEDTITHVQSVLTNLKDTYTQFVASGGKKEATNWCH